MNFCFISGNIIKTKGPNNKSALLNQVSVRVGLSSEQEHYHVPLLVSPWGYQIYRGS
ncbi:hydroxyisourate hydrolase [Priestia megaterium]